MTYEAFRDAAAVEQTERKPALEAELLAKRTAEMAREAAWEAECERERRKAEEAQLRYESECRKVEEAHALLITIPAERQKTPKLKSAIRTTHGGALRDMQRWDEAIALGTEAHTLTQKDFRPCTLLGAVNFELGNYDLAKAWYDKAVERGASEKTIDHDLRGIFERADKAKREEIRAILLREDPVRYG